MTIRHKKGILLFFALVLVLAVATACTQEAAPEAEEPAAETPEAEAPAEEEPQELETIIFGDAGWDSLRLHNAIAGFILDHGYGYDYDVIPGSTPNILEGVIKGDVTVLMEMWQDNVPIYPEYREAGTILELGTNFDDNAQGLYVPRYVIEGDPERGIEASAPDLKHVEDLKNYPDLFPDPEDPGMGLIVNGPPSWAVTTIMEVKGAHYGLDEMYNISGSGTAAALAASLSAAYERGEPWVGYYWEPTWITGKYDLVLLEEAPYDDDLWNEEAGYACEFKPSDITIIINPEFAGKNPAVTEFLTNYETSSALTAVGLAYMQDNDAEIDEAAEWFIQEYEDLWKDWVTSEAHEKVMAALK